MILANRMARLGSETAFEVLAAAKAREARGHRVLHLEIGEPDFNPSENIVKAAVKALDEGWHHYTPAVGIREFREAIARDAGTRRGIEIDPDEVVVTPGGKPIIFYTILSLVNEGDEVIYPDPGFPIYTSMINFVGGKHVPIAQREELDFRIDIEELVSLVTPKTRLIILNSPNNPTGSVLTRGDLERVAEICRDREIHVLSDEIYGRLLYEGEHHSIASLPGMRERTIILDGFSKTYAMTGWRLGYGIMNRALAGHFGKLMINSNSCTAAFSQIAGIEALTGSQNAVEQMLTTFRRRRDRVVELLNGIDGVSCRAPKGAFYAFTNVKSLGLPSRTIQRRLLDEANVAVLPGSSFGEYGEGYLRLSYATSLEVLEEAIERMAEALPKMGS